MSGRRLAADATRPAWAGVVLLLLAALAAGPAQGAPVVDPTGDFIASYLGPLNADLDVISAEVTFNPSTQVFHLTGTMNAAVFSLTPGALYVWGFDRGAGFPGFAGIGNPGVIFDSVVVLSSAGFTAVDLAPGGGVTGTGGVSVSGATISADIPLALLPTQGFTPFQYTWNLWPESEGGPPTFISDFAPDNSNAAVTVIPEPATLGVR